MALGWGTRRQLLYYLVGTVVLAVLLVFVYYAFIKVAPTCFDGKENATEHGIDCGGTCSLICTNEANDPTVLWSRTFQTSGNFYTAAAYIKNNNPGAGAKHVPYIFQLYDEKNLLVKAVEGVIDLPPIPVIPIVEHNINVGNRQIVRTQFSFSSGATWNTISASALPALRIGEQKLQPGATRLDATLRNDSLDDARNVTVTAVLFDQEGVARGAVKQELERVPKKSSQPLVFTWPIPQSNIVRAEITISPSF
ncbi:hypothetical protein KW798_03880 [Candidatus Parcubacteria bacterium]|nr:hypothetical protein [Candidatus Parcubacteria bacterium]